MFVIGLCGQSGSGKSTVSEYLTKKGIDILCCDTIYHDITSRPTKCLSEIEKHFGNEVIINDSLDRKKLGSIVFNNQEKIKLLNSITHPCVCEEIEKMLKILKEKNKEFCVIDAPLLFEAGLDKICNFVVGVIANEDIRIERLIKRDSISSEIANIRHKNQLSDSFLKSHCDFIIENNSDLNNLYMQIDKIFTEMRNRNEKE